MAKMRDALKGVKRIETISNCPMGDVIADTSGKRNISRGKGRSGLLGLTYATKAGLGAAFWVLLALLKRWMFSITEGEAVSVEVMPEDYDWESEFAKQRDEIANRDYFGNGADEIKVPNSDDKLRRASSLREFDRYHVEEIKADGTVVFRKPKYLVVEGHRRIGRGVQDASALRVDAGESPILTVTAVVLEFEATGNSSADDVRRNYIIYSNERRKGGFQATSTAEKFQAGFDMFDRAQTPSEVTKVFNNGEKQRLVAMIWYAYRFSRVIDEVWAEQLRTDLCNPEKTTKEKKGGFIPSSGGGDTKTIREEHQKWTHDTLESGTKRAKDVLLVQRFVETPEGKAAVQKLMALIDSIRSGETKTRAPKQVDQSGLSDIASRFDADDPRRQAMEHLKANEKSKALQALLSVTPGMTEEESAIMDSLKAEVTKGRAEKAELERQLEVYKDRLTVVLEIVEQTSGGIKNVKKALAALPELGSLLFVEAEAETEAA